MTKILLPFVAGVVCLVSDTASRATSVTTSPPIAVSLPGNIRGRSLVRAGDDLSTAPSQGKTIIFAERVAYQRAIEEVYWRHQIWPKERPDAKPSLDAVMTQAQLEEKITDFTRNSHLLEDYWHQSLTAEQLQAEMDRMARHTKQPEVLHELFAALGKNPFVIAECLVRPILTERLLADLSLQGEAQLFEPPNTGGLRTTSVTTAMGQAPYSLPKISGADDLPCTNDTWTATSTTNAPGAQFAHTAVWTGSEMIVWGGVGQVNTGGRYNPSTDSWLRTGTANAPVGRELHTAVWTGTEMIVWGGAFDDSCCTIQELNTGGKYNPRTNTWTATNTTNAPTARASHLAVWTGSEMIVWGGGDDSGPLNTGGRYNPSTDSWRRTTTTNAPPPRFNATAVWTGSEMIVWGGGNFGYNYNIGGKYNPSTDSWTATSTTLAPSGRFYHTAVWTGKEMIVWGGLSDFGRLNTGGKYDPATDRWSATSTTNAPSARESHTAVWTGSEMIVWGGVGDFGVLNTGGRYNPGMDGWMATSTTNAPDARYSPTAVWTGNQMIIWGGTDDERTFNTGGRYCAPFLGSQLGNISTRALVQTGDNVMIGGFIVQGTGLKRVIIRGIGPELSQFGVPDPLGNPRLELHNSVGALIGSNDDWQHTIIGGIITRSQVADIQNSGHAPANPFESAIIADLAPGNYTAIVRGVNSTTGVALIEVYDLGNDASSLLGNISTRSFVQTNDNVMIGGFIVQGTGAKRVIIRAIGPELGPFGVPDPLANPTLELHNAAGALIGSNDDWQHTIIGGVITHGQVSDIQNSGHAPTDPSESAIIAELQPGNYTAIVRGVNNTTGVALVEVYDLD